MFIFIVLIHFSTIFSLQASGGFREVPDQDPSPLFPAATEVFQPTPPICLFLLPPSSPLRTRHQERAEAPADAASIKVKCGWNGTATRFGGSCGIGRRNLDSFTFLNIFYSFLFFSCSRKLTTLPKLYFLPNLLWISKFDYFNNFQQDHLHRSPPPLWLPHQGRRGRPPLRPHLSQEAAHIQRGPGRGRVQEEQQHQSEIRRRRGEKGIHSALSGVWSFPGKRGGGGI